MCGITGVISKEEIKSNEISDVKNSIQKLEKRGPDASGFKNFGKTAFGHRRLSIIDTKAVSNQPMSDVNRRFTIVFNGEIYNYKELKSELKKENYQFSTDSDTEVLLQMYSRYGTSFLNKLNGFFALAIHDQQDNSVLLARDRFGIKPLLYCNTEHKLYFASEMKALIEYDIPKELDNSSIYTYLQLNYIPEPHSIFKEVKKLEPGHYLKIDASNRTQKIPFYQLNYPVRDVDYSSISYESAQEKFLHLLDESVQKRMIADVPLGTFLSGGIDSSLITALASKHTSKLSTFSIGFSDDPHFDETKYALLVAKKFNTDHHVFSLSRNDLLTSLHETLDYLDEPFADSSALAVNALSRETAQHVKVALSGDGADELFAGYHKHHGEFLMRQPGLKQEFVKTLKPLWDLLPKSRGNKMGNLFRKMHKFSEGARLSKDERYWLWAGLMNEADASNLMVKKASPEIYLKRKEQILSQIKDSQDFNDVLYTDLKLVLQSDMLRKVDLMSMANGLEVRTPFLDHNLVNFSFELSSNFKINKSIKKRIVQDASRSILPEELYNRPKQGFEVPLLAWFNNELSDLIHNDLLSDSFIKEQNLFNPSFVSKLKNQLKSPNPSDSQGNIWALIVFNSWWKRYIA